MATAMTTARMSQKQAMEKLGVRVLELEQVLVENTQILAERDTKIAELEAQLAAASRPVALVESPSVKALPILAADPKTRKAVCPLDAEHGSVTPNVKGRCPQCFTEAARAAAMTRYAARAAA